MSIFDSLHVELRKRHKRVDMRERSEYKYRQIETSEILHSTNRIDDTILGITDYSYANYLNQYRASYTLKYKYNLEIIRQFKISLDAEVNTQLRISSSDIAYLGFSSDVVIRDIIAISSWTRTSYEGFDTAKWYYNYDINMRIDRDMDYILKFSKVVDELVIDVHRVLTTDIVSTDPLSAETLGDIVATYTTPYVSTMDIQLAVDNQIWPGSINQEYSQILSNLEDVIVTELTDTTSQVSVVAPVVYIDNLVEIPRLPLPTVSAIPGFTSSELVESLGVITLEMNEVTALTYTLIDLDTVMPVDLSPHSVEYRDSVIEDLTTTASSLTVKVTEQYTDFELDLFLNTTNTWVSRDTINQNVEFREFNPTKDSTAVLDKHGEVVEVQLMQSSESSDVSLILIDLEDRHLYDIAPERVAVVIDALENPLPYWGT